ncbi:MAG: AmmeMemoRadiSam system protein B [Candidatus Latescibacteria bacterium]|nr:AmmeMemoRadiSam system protein B [Candidatus Latescibacterota bacterium]NIO29000.1 AmmeMemoRadiSam system protein B [Candidatus Latescibacterota bacterium]NIO56625.1 AmmeMemoRadiSam system protein B [Candidatus Latescibacterota bacterium]NIT02209.1 AmmeMemoRadiSam system protein B [Candidatus Latescibacterota bacterium]NIT39094.1 AmmeMemoRadiSam system protein B [Candidatus Latescibacterota bacterium]
MRFKLALLLVLLVQGFFSATHMLAGGQDVRQLLDQVGIKPKGDQRGLMDIVGYASTAEQMDKVLSQCRNLASAEGEARQGWRERIQDKALVAGVCPHDDYYYSARLYSLLLSNVRANRVILFGVFHKARVFNCKDQLVFDSYRTWHGPYAPVAVSPLRERIIERLPSEDYIVNNEMQMVEHSVEGIVSFLQALNRDVEIVSILVPYMNWHTLDRLAANLTRAIASIVQEEGWQLGRDVCLISSADAVHYGDAGWGGYNFAPFGTDVMGYQMAVKRDLELAEKYLCGPIDHKKLKGLMYSCVDSTDVTEYLITWCGRFAVPFGLNVASRLTKALEGRVLEGLLLDYGTSVSEVSLDVSNLNGMGPTAPNNFHHFVGYAAIGYWQD